MLEDLFQPAMDDLDRVASGDSNGCIPTGFAELDDVTGGLSPGTLTVIGAYPGTGASTLALDFARSAAIRHGLPAAFLTLDSHEDRVMQKVLSAESRIKHSDMRTGRMTEDDWTRLARRMAEISEAPLIIERPTDVEITAIAKRINTLAAGPAVKLFVVDSLHLVTARTGLPYENREREVGEVARQLKKLALDSNTAIVATSQLSNNPGPRQPIPRPPTFADLRDSGAIAHVADNVLLLHRPDAYERDDPRGGEADIMLVKHRFGTTATVTVAHQLHYARFVDMARG